jgi:hypothetical protein
MMSKPQALIERKLRRCLLVIKQVKKSRENVPTGRGMAEIRRINPEGDTRLFVVPLSNSQNDETFSRAATSETYFLSK